MTWSARPDDDREWHLTLMAYDAEWNAADQIPRRAVDAGRLSRLGSIDTTLGGETSRHSLSGGWHGPLGGGRARLHAYVIDYELDLFSNFTYWLDDPVDGDQLEQLDDRTVAKLDFAFTFASGPRSSHTFGAALRHDDIDDVGLFRSKARQRIEPIRRDRVEQRSVGLYYSNETDWTARLRTILGLRADRYDFDVTSAFAPNSGTAEDSIVSPKASLIYAVSDAVELY